MRKLLIVLANEQGIAVSADIICTSAPLMYKSQIEIRRLTNVLQPALQQYAIIKNL